MNVANLLSSCVTGQRPFVLSLYPNSDLWGLSLMKTNRPITIQEDKGKPTGTLFISGSAFQIANSNTFRTTEPKSTIYLFVFFFITSRFDRVICWFARLSSARLTIHLSPSSQRENSPGGKRCCSGIQTERLLRLFRPQISSNLARCESGRPCWANKEAIEALGLAFHCSPGPLEGPGGQRVRSKPYTQTTVSHLNIQ